MAEQRHPAIGTWQRQGDVGDAADLAHQLAGRAVDARDVTGHRRGIAAVALEIECDGNITCMRQSQRIGLHELA